MIANYHTHTWRCNHAEHNERAYIERAIGGGLKILGFADHTPYPFPEGHDSFFRMEVGQLENYVTTLSALKKEYEKDIEIHIGLEAEYYPKYFGQLQDLIKDYPIEYMILAQHFINNEIGETYSASRTYSKKRFERYCDQAIEAMETGYFTYFAHPDIFNFKGPKAIYQDGMRRVCRCAKKMNIPLEINFLGLMEKRNYPTRRFWEIAGQEKNQVIFGSDAHKAKYVVSEKAVEKATRRLVDRYQLDLVETVELRKPF